MIRLRKIEPQDLPFLYQWENDAASWSEGSTHNPLSQKDLRDYIASSTGDIYRDGQLRLIIETEDKACVGCADLFDLDPRNRRAAIGLYIEPANRGKGIAGEALEEMEKYAFKFLQLRVIYAVIGMHNKACGELFRSHNYLPSSPLKNWTLEGDAVVWTKVKSER